MRLRVHGSCMLPFRSRRDWPSCPFVTLTDSERRALGYKALPASLDRAISLMEGSELVAETLGEHVFNYVLKNKRQDWDNYRAQVTPYELKSNLEML